MQEVNQHIVQILFIFIIDNFSIFFCNFTFNFGTNDTSRSEFTRKTKSKILMSENFKGLTLVFNVTLCKPLLNQLQQIIYLKYH